MINKTELEIANKSYTNKDFATIYPELLELATTLTNRWDPSTSNESDPGVVLLKLLAFVGDKLNYNIDKNILEAFMPSATQESSMRKLCEMGGYEMGYYESATTDLTFMYRGKMGVGDDKFTLRFPAYSTVVTGSDKTVTYVLLEDVELTERTVSSLPTPAIEGTMKSLCSKSENALQLSNLDDNNRVYFPEKYVASNGIFVSNYSEYVANTSLWEKVDSLSTIPTGTRCYKFGFDSSKNLPYIEFPADIVSLIENGINVRYIITQGSEGNVRARFLTTLLNTTSLSDFISWETSAAVPELEADIDDLIILNNSASTNGKDPETIDEAYNSFKKVVGTFDTLVTPRDYADFIYRIISLRTNDYVVSNIQVADRRTDINYGNNVVSFNEFGQHVQANENIDKITPFDLCVYPLNSTNSNYDEKSYYNSFKPLSDNRRYEDIKDGINDAKAVSHNLKSHLESKSPLEGGDVYLYKNYYNLNVKLATDKKVTNSEAKTITDNVKSALYKNFNAREVDYGYEIPYETILSVIQQADTRIKSVSLDEPELNTKVMRAKVNSNEVDYLKTDSTGNGMFSEHQKLLAKNIVSGRLSLFDYYEDFSFDFYQSSAQLYNEDDIEIAGGPIIDGLVSLGTEVVIHKSAVESGYKLKENEVIQLTGPNLFTKITYPAYVNFKYVGEPVKANLEYELGYDDELMINYTDSDGIERNISYKEGDIIRPSFDLKETLKNRAILNKNFNGTSVDMYQLTAQETIDIRDFVKSTLTGTWKCYWLLDEGSNPENCLFRKGEKETILAEGESFLYTDDSMSELVILGSGTKLTLKTAPTTDADWTINRAELLNKETIEYDGLLAFSDADWQNKSFSENNLTIQEMSIYTFGEGSTIKVSAVGKNITNTQQELDNDVVIEYKEDDSSMFKSVPQYSSSSAKWSINSRLDLNVGPTRGQKLISDVNAEQKIILTSVDVEENPTKIIVEQDSGKNTFIYLNTSLQRSGGKNIDMRVTTYTDSGDSYISYDVSALCINKSAIDKDFTRSSKTGLIVYEIKNYSGVKKLPIITAKDKKTLILFYWAENDSVQSIKSITLSTTGSGSKVSIFNKGDTSTTLQPGLNVVEISGDETELKMTIALKSGTNFSNISDTLTIGKLKVINDYNYKRFGFSEDNKVALTKSLLDEIEQLGKKDGKNIFYYNAELDPSNLIEVDDVSSPYALFDYNNLANPFTLAEIDVRNSKISVLKSSRV